MKDPWRYRCPNGHTSWSGRKNVNGTGYGGGPTATAKYYCEHCGPFDELIDMKKQP